MTLNEWIVKGIVGISSKTMWAALKGLEINQNYGDKPYDPDDFSRCYKLVKMCGLTKSNLNIITQKLPYWKPYINNWDKLCEMYEANTANDWKTHKQIGMYDFMQELRIKSDAIRFNCA